MTYKLWRISGIDDIGEKKLHECYDNLDSPAKKYFERPDTAQKGKRDVMVYTNREDPNTENFEKIYRTFVAELPLEGCSYESKDIAENDLNTAISEFLGIGGAVSEQNRSKKNVKVQDSTLKEMFESYIHRNYGDTEWFSSAEVKMAFDTNVKKIGITTASTYLGRMFHGNILQRKGNRNNRKYKITDYGRKMLKERYGIPDDG